MKNWRTTLLGILSATGVALMDFPGLIGQIAKTVAVAATVFLGGAAKDASNKN